MNRLAFLLNFLIFLVGSSLLAAEGIDLEALFKSSAKISVSHIERGTLQTGSGFCIKNEEGRVSVLTAGHVVATADGFYNVLVWQYYPTAMPLVGRINVSRFDVAAGGDDYALITVDSPSSLVPINVSKNKPAVGDILYRVGSTHGEWVDLSLTYCTSITGEFIEFSPSAKPGDSGGMLVNTKGEVVGLVLYGGERYGRARLVASILDKLELNDRKPQVQLLPDQR